MTEDAKEPNLVAFQRTISVAPIAGVSYDARPTYPKFTFRTYSGAYLTGTAEFKMVLGMVHLNFLS